MKDGEHYHNGSNPEGKHDHKKLAGIILLAVILGLVAYSLAQSAQTTADINNVFELSVNNTDLGSMGTGERVAGVKYFANDSPLYIEIITHTVNTGVDVVFNFSINDTVVWSYDKRTAISDEHHSVVQIVPKFSSYEFNRSTSIHHYEWREYPILSGRNGTVILNQTFITNGSSFNATYDQTTKEYNSNYTAQSFPNSSALTYKYGNYTGDGTADRSITHGLGKIPAFVIVTQLESSYTTGLWHIGGSPTPGTAIAYSATGNIVFIGGVAGATSTAFTVGVTNGDYLNQNGNHYNWTVIG